MKKLIYYKTNLEAGYLSAKECLWCNTEAKNKGLHGEISINTIEGSAVGFRIGYYICPNHTNKSVSDTYKRLHQLLKGWMT